MIKPAQLYTEELKRKFVEIMYKDKYKYYFNGWSSEFVPDKDNWSNHSFVVLDKEEVIGYIAYSIDRRTDNVDSLQIVNFSDNKYLFGKAVYKIIKDIFNYFKFNKISFAVNVGNPAELIYNKFISKYGGRVVGVKTKDTRLIDGTWCDYKMYEIFNKEKEG